MPTPAFHRKAATLPATTGAYLLIVRLRDPLLLTLPGRPQITLSAGRYLYSGSARGPGGVRARVGRHMRRDKRQRWHIDRLTSAGRVIGCWVFPDGDECALIARLAALPVPVPGFGSSDCPRCRSHLLFWPRGVKLPAGSGQRF